MGKGLKPGLAVVAAHAALPEAAEAHVRRGQMNDGVIHTATAKGAAGQYLVGQLSVPCENIERQRVRLLVNEADHVVDGVISQNRQQGSEDFLLHDVVPPDDPIENSRLDF